MHGVGMRSNASLPGCRITVKILSNMPVFQPDMANERDEGKQDHG